MSRSVRKLFVYVLAAACADPVAAALYKWTDAQGRIVYSDQPPSANVKTEQFRGPPPPAKPNAAKELAERQAADRKRTSEAAEAASKAEKTRADTARISEACLPAMSQLMQLTESQLAIYRYIEKGEREVMDDDARGRERAKLNAFIRDNKCAA
jgi:hypothetical protein